MINICIGHKTLLMCYNAMIKELMILKTQPALLKMNLFAECFLDCGSLLGVGKRTNVTS